jgi:hypothetical protein
MSPHVVCHVVFPTEDDVFCFCMSSSLRKTTSNVVSDFEIAKTPPPLHNPSQPHRHPSIINHPAARPQLSHSLSEVGGSEFAFKQGPP